MVYRGKWRGKKNYLRLAESTTTFARVSMVGVHSDLQVQNCDFKYRLSEESQDNTFSSCRNINYIFFGGWEEKEIKMRNWGKKTKDGDQRYRRKKLNEIRSRKSTLGIQLHFPWIFTQVSILPLFLPYPLHKFQRGQSKERPLCIHLVFFKGYLQHLSSKEMLNLNKLSEKLAKNFFPCLSTIPISL